MRDRSSLGYRTDLFVRAFDGVVEDRGRHIVVRTPSNPGFWWGNFLLYPLDRPGSGRRLHVRGAIGALHDLDLAGLELDAAEAVGHLFVLGDALVLGERADSLRDRVTELGCDRIGGHVGVLDGVVEQRASDREIGVAVVLDGEGGTSMATAPTWVMYGSSEPGTFRASWARAAKCQARMKRSREKEEHMRRA